MKLDELKRLAEAEMPCRDPQGAGMTFDDDHVQLNTKHGIVRQTCKALGLEWPPPEQLNVTFGEEFPSLTFRRIRYSSITDKQREQMTHVCRGAEYERLLP